MATTADELRRAAAACEAALSDYYSAEPMILRLSNAARALDTSLETVRAWVRAGRLPVVRLGRAVYVDRRDLIAFIDRHKS